LGGPEPTSPPSSIPDIIIRAHAPVNDICPILQFPGCHKRRGLALIHLTPHISTGFSFCYGEDDSRQFGRIPPGERRTTKTITRWRYCPFRVIAQRTAAARLGAVLKPAHTNTAAGTRTSADMQRGRNSREKSSKEFTIPGRNPPGSAGISRGCVTHRDRLRREPLRRIQPPRCGSTRRDGRTV